MEAALMKRALLAAGLLGSGCTMVTGAGDYEVDPDREQEIIDTMLLSMTRDLDYSFAAMDAHANSPLDVAIVNANNVMQARARIIMPRSVEGEYPTERLVMQKALTPGQQQLFFYADSDSNNLVNSQEDDPEEFPGFEHIWIEPVPPSGQGLFTHSTNFIFFTEDAFTTNQDLILEPPMLDLGNLTPQQLAECVQKKFDALFDETFEVKVFLTDEERQVGYFKMYEGGAPPKDFRVRLPGIIDNGTEYSFKVLLDGELEEGREFTIRAPASGPLSVPASKWLGLEKLMQVTCR
jgi:hypothetical protein